MEQLKEKIEVTNNEATIQKENNKAKKVTICGYSLWRICAYFIVYSFLGYIIETLFGILTKGVIESRQSFLYGPFCCIYGLGAICLICIPKKLKGNNVYLFIAGLVIGSAVEYIVSWAGEYIFHIKWWDYSDLPFNINGRICLLSSIFWGALTLLLNNF